MVKNLFKNPFFLIFAGALTIYLAFKGSSDKVLCDGVEMSQGDVCGTLSYEDKVRSAEIFTYGLIGLGVAVIVASVLTIRKKRNSNSNNKK